MLVCNVSLRPPRSAIAAELAEAATAVDALATGNVVFATLVDDPASVGDLVDAYLGEIMLEAASADAVADAGLVFAAAVVEAIAAGDTPDATITGAPAGTTWNPSDKDSTITLSSGNSVATSNSSSSFGGVRGTKSLSAGKAYLEFTFTYSTFANAYPGIALASKGLSGFSGSTGSAQVEMNTGQMQINGSNPGFIDGFVTFLSGDVLCIALDLTNQTIWFRRNAGTWNNSGTANPATNTGGFDVSAMFSSAAAFPYVQFPNSSPVNEAINGGSSAFAQSIPSGFTAWDSA
jgi:hypothetical protein